MQEKLVLKAQPRKKEILDETERYGYEKKILKARKNRWCTSLPRTPKGGPKK